MKVCDVCSKPIGRKVWINKASTPVYWCGICLCKFLEGRSNFNGAPKVYNETGYSSKHGWGEWSEFEWEDGYKIRLSGGCNYEQSTYYIRLRIFGRELITSLWDKVKINKGARGLRFILGSVGTREPAPGQTNYGVVQNEISKSRR